MAHPKRKKYALSGGSYLNPKGQELTRIIVADWHRKELGIEVTSDDIIHTRGASHAIGAVFKALGEEGCGFLQAGDRIAIGSPVYSPYNRIIEERGLIPLPYSINPFTGELGEIDTNAKVLILIDPNNPTGFSLREEDLERLAKITKENNMLVITDEVYSSFFCHPEPFDSAEPVLSAVEALRSGQARVEGPKKKTMLALAPERTICINSRSKIERSTGLRFGEIIILPEGRLFITKLLALPPSKSLEELLIFSKAPGRSGGQFQHTTFVPGPSQLLGIAHIVLGKRERETYLQKVQENRDLFCRELSLPHKGNTYYIIFDLNALPGCRTQKMPIDEKLLCLAKAGVVFIPAYRFFVENDRTEETLSYVRASVVNTTPEKLKEATRRVREILC